jgi:hypothetical protein
MDTLMVANCACRRLAQVMSCAGAGESVAVATGLLTEEGSRDRASMRRIGDMY